MDELNPPDKHIPNMKKRDRSLYPEIYCDLNARMTERGYLLTNGSVKDLEILGLTLDAAIGQQFVFYMEDADGNGHPDDIMFDCSGEQTALHSSSADGSFMEAELSQTLSKQTNIFAGDL